MRALCSAAAIGLRHGHGTEVFFRSLRYTEKELRAFSNGSQHFTRDYFSFFMATRRELRTAAPPRSVSPSRSGQAPRSSCASRRPAMWTPTPLRPSGRSCAEPLLPSASPFCERRLGARQLQRIHAAEWFLLKPVWLGKFGTSVQPPFLAAALGQCIRSSRIGRRCGRWWWYRLRRVIGQRGASWHRGRTERRGQSRGACAERPRAERAPESRASFRRRHTRAPRRRPFWLRSVRMLTCRVVSGYCERSQS